MAPRPVIAGLTMSLRALPCHCGLYHVIAGFDHVIAGFDHVIAGFDHVIAGSDPQSP